MSIRRQPFRPIKAATDGHHTVTTSNCRSGLLPLHMRVFASHFSTCLFVSVYKFDLTAMEFNPHGSTFFGGGPDPPEYAHGHTLYDA